MSKHSEGPWMAAAKPSSIVGWPVVSPRLQGRLICNVTVGHDQSAANARLIAAAPELLSALRVADEAINPPDRSGISLANWNDRLKEATAIIRAAIAKAEGQS